MAGETYYFLFSIVFVEGIVLYFINLLLLRGSGKTTFGITFKPGTEDHKRVVSRLANNRNLIIVSIITLGLVANLIHEVIRVLHFDNREYAHFLGIAAVGTIVLSGVIYLVIYKQTQQYIKK